MYFIQTWRLVGTALDTRTKHLPYSSCWKCHMYVSKGKKKFVVGKEAGIIPQGYKKKKEREVERCYHVSI